MSVDKENDDEFGFQHRDPGLLDKISTSQTMPQEEQDSGSGERQSVSSCADSTADGPSDSGAARKKGILKESSDLHFGAVYDASKRKESVAVQPTAEQKPTPAKRSSVQGSRKKMASSDKDDPTVKEEELPQKFQVKYLGCQEASGLWGIKHTRKPVDTLVSAAKALKQGTVLPIVNIIVSTEGLTITPDKKPEEVIKFFPVDTISYGVQDLVYTRVFSMIVVREVQDNKVHPFECYGFVCDSRYGARKLTYALAAAFQAYSRNAKAKGQSAAKKRFAIDLRTTEQIVEIGDNMPDSEA